jgi:hypothetical protein
MSRASEECKCKLSVELKLVKNGELTGVIGVFKEVYYTRHKTLMCPIEEHRETDQRFYY